MYSVNIKKLLSENKHEVTNVKSAKATFFIQIAEIYFNNKQFYILARTNTDIFNNTQILWILISIKMKTTTGCWFQN